MKSTKSSISLLIGLFVLGIQSIAQPPGGGRPGGGGGDWGGRQQRSSQGQQQRQGIPGTLESTTPKGNGKITGMVRDSASKSPVEFAAISLVDVKTNNPIDGTTTDEKGKFSLTKVAEGEFKILISFIGYNTKEIPGIKIEKRTEIDLGTIDLGNNIVQLDEVQVVGMAQLVEEKVDRLIFNAEKDITSRGGDAADVMRKVPMLTVDLDGNVSLRGSSNVKVLINNKPSTIIATSVGDALKQIPAELIKSVEVITSPSARYDAEGTAGIINIITKRSKIQGGTLDFNTGVGNRGSNFGLRGNYRSGKLGVSLGGFGRWNYNMPSKSDNLQTNKLNDFTTRQSMEGKNKMLFGNVSMGLDYDLDENSYLAAGVRYGGRSFWNNQDMTIMRTSGGVTENSFREVKTKDLSGTWDVNIDYFKTLKKPSEELSLMALFSRNNRTNDYDANVYSGITSDRTYLGLDWNNNASHNQESTLQADYQTSFGKNQLLEVGGKGIFRQVFSDIEYGGLNNRPANALDYDQNVGAGYLSYTFSTKDKWSFKGGARYEYTTINARQDEGGDLNIPSYGNLVPSLNISKTFGKKQGQTIKASYNRRLQRPGIQYLNPNVNSANPQNITQGNPELDPELTDQVELGTSFFKNSLYINVTGFARFTNNSIESIRTINEDVITTTYGNIGTKRNYGVNIYGNITLFKIWQVGGGVDGYYASLNNNSGDVSIRSSNSGYVFSGRFRTGLNFKNGWGFQGGGFMRGKEVQLQGTQMGFRMYDLGLKKDFKNKRGSIGFGMENFLAPRFNMKTVMETATFTQVNNNFMYNRGFRMNFSYKLGKMEFVEQKRKRGKSISNDDQKSGSAGAADSGGR
ncbi:MAG: TonB-dependent receptor [Cytophagaceae bacterium SCN 52-12]|nr:MAG: TonB-dependent receptor [Cytophagaceae bacterium SCN 52-12]